MTDFQFPKTNPALQEIPTNRYIKMDGNGVAYTIVGQQAVDNMHKNLMG